LKSLERVNIPVKDDLAITDEARPRFPLEDAIAHATEDEAHRGETHPHPEDHPDSAQMRDHARVNLASVGLVAELALKRVGSDGGRTAATARKDRASATIA
jgi:hypothetical protein